MIPSESDPQTELLRSIATSLKGIQFSLEQLTGAVEGVAESIEKAHEPEGDLGHHLVGALKDLSSALHKRAQQERSPLPQQPPRRDERPQPHQQHRRDERPQQNQQRHEERPQRENSPRDPIPTKPSEAPTEFQPDIQGKGEPGEPLPVNTAEGLATDVPHSSQEPAPRKRPFRKRRGGKDSGKQIPNDTTFPTTE